MLTPGSHLPGYEIRRQIGAGGMGVVYLAHDLTLGRSVAIKVLSGEVALDPGRVRRFQQEARAASALSHPNVCVVHALGETSAGEPFIAMEYVEGHTLRHLLQTRPPGLKEALDIAIQIAAAAAAAHAIGIVHRDLKPENVIVRQDGLVKVLDFGLAKLAPEGLPVDGATRTLVRTEAGMVMGTFTYMAPEQARGQEVDARADVWALGVILYEMVSGRVPFTGDTRSDVIVSILEREPPPLDRLNPLVPHELQRIAAKALRKDRAQRYQTIADMRLDLEAVRGELQASSQDGSPAAVSALPPETTPQSGRRESSAEYVLSGLARHKRAAAAGLFIIAALAAGIMWQTRSGTPDSSPTSATQVQRNLTRLTFGAGLQTDPTLSPDGRFLAYASDRAGNFDIWVQPIAGGDPVQVTKDLESDTQPAWSPDGSSIVFRSERAGGGLFVVPALGGQPRRLTAFGQGRLRFYAMPAHGGARHELATPVLERGSWSWVAEHPDGRISAVGTHESLGDGFFTFSRSGEHLIKSDVSVAPELGNYVSAGYFRFLWNRAGTRLYVEAQINFIYNLWRVEVDPATLAWRSAERLTTGGTADINAVLSPDETKVAYAQLAPSGRLWSFPFDAATGRLTGEGVAFSEEGAFASHVDLSADGRSAVYNVVRPGGQGAEIWVHHFDTGQQQMVVPVGAWPRWIPGKNSIVYNKWRNDDESTVVLREPDGTERQLSPWDATRQLQVTDATADGRTMLVSAYSLAATPLWSWRVDRFSNRPEKVIIDRPGAHIWQAQLSPNGRWLAFVPHEGGSGSAPQVAIAPMETIPITEWRFVAPTLPNTDKPRWAPDGRTLYFLTPTDGYYNLTGVPFDTDRGLPAGEPFEVTHFASPSLMVSPHMSVSEIGIAGERVVLPMMSSTGSIWMLDNVDK